jgi:catechol-2,3-dioxygenase
MTRIALEGITLLADDVAVMGAFFEDVLGFEVTVRESDYLALANDGVRLAVFRRAGW